MKKLASVVEKSIAPGQVGRLMVYCRILPKIGRADTLADIASTLSEHIHQQGRSGDLLVVLEDVLASSDVSVLDRFVVADTPALWEYHQPDKTRFIRLVRIMEQLAKEADLKPEDRSRLTMKQMLEAALERDVSAMASFAETALKGADTPLLRRIVSYNIAVAFYVTDNFREALAVTVTGKLIEEYFETLGLTDQISSILGNLAGRSLKLAFGKGQKIRPIRIGRVPGAVLAENQIAAQDARLDGWEHVCAQVFPAQQPVNRARPNTR
jgi:hypothetical protein